MYLSTSRNLIPHNNDSACLLVGLSQTDVEAFGNPRLELANGLDRRVRCNGGQFFGRGHVASVAGAETPSPERHLYSIHLSR